jgi:hypothetical protein
MKRVLLISIAALVLAGCEKMPPELTRLFKPAETFKPMTSEVAVMAAPDGALPPVGKPVLCRVSQGAFMANRQWQDFRPASFQLSPDARVTVRLEALRGRGAGSLQAIYPAGDQKLIFCPLASGPPDKKVACASIYALDDDLEAGIKRTFDIPDAVMGGEITCAYTEAALRR